MIKMVAFDMDGTLVDTYKFFTKAFVGALSPYYGGEVPIEKIEKGFGLNELGMIKIILSSHHNEALDEYHRLYELYHDEAPDTFFGMNELIAFLQQKNIKLAVITGKGAVACDISLKKIGMTNVFCDVMTGHEQRVDKSGAINDLLLKHNLTKEEFLYIGDVVSDVMESRKSGVTCLSACWADTVDLPALKSVNPDYIFTTVANLKSYLESII